MSTGAIEIPDQVRLELLNTVGERALKRRPLHTGERIRHEDNAYEGLVQFTHVRRQSVPVGAAEERIGTHEVASR